MAENQTTFPAATVGLLTVYGRVRPGYVFERNVPRRCLTKPSVPAGNGGCDNESHDLILHVNDVLADPHTPEDEYVVLDMLGTGTFGQVVKCFHKKGSRFVAVKIVKNQPAYFNQAWVEINILRMLHRDTCPDDTTHIVQFKSHFVLRGHLCLVFEKLSINLYELLKQNRYAGIGIPMLRTFITQLLSALAVLVRAEVVHCDLKPENILLTSLDAAELKLIDFGSACQLQHPVYSYVQSRFYRSPEILLGLPEYDSKIDMWSLGCVAAELFLGLPLFPGQNAMNMMYRIEEMLGPFPDMFLRRCRLTTKFFKQAPAGSANFRVFSLKSVAEFEAENGVPLPEWKRYFKERRLRDVIMGGALRSAPPSSAGHHPHHHHHHPSHTHTHTHSPQQPQQPQDPLTAQAHAEELAIRDCFVDFLSGLLRIDPEARWTPTEALEHPFIATGGPLPGGQPWTPSRVPRTRPVQIESHHPAAAAGGPGADFAHAASLPTFVGAGAIAHQPASFADVGNSIPGSASAINVHARGGGAHAGPHGAGASSYIPVSAFPDFAAQARGSGGGDAFGAGRGGSFGASADSPGVGSTLGTARFRSLRSEHHGPHQHQHQHQHSQQHSQQHSHQQQYAHQLPQSQQQQHGSLPQRMAHELSAREHPSPPRAVQFHHAQNQMYEAPQSGFAETDLEARSATPMNISRVSSPAPGSAGYHPVPTAALGVPHAASPTMDQQSRDSFSDLGGLPTSLSGSQNSQHLGRTPSSGEMEESVFGHWGEEEAASGAGTGDAHVQMVRSPSQASATDQFAPVPPSGSSLRPPLQARARKK